MSDLKICSRSLTGIISLQAYYDIFVRHAFGSYRDILKEVSYSPLMAEMLSFKDSKSTAYVWKTMQRVDFADENFAREVMQLFSIGLYMLNANGTRVMDDDGDPIQTYSNDDITEYARLWTGFQERPMRGNIEINGVGKKIHSKKWWNVVPSPHILSLILQQMTMQSTQWPLIS